MKKFNSIILFFLLITNFCLSNLSIAQDKKIDPEYDELVSQQKFNEALKRIQVLIAKSSNSKNYVQSANLIATQTNLKIALHGYEKAVNDLRSMDWPKDKMAQTILNLVYGHSLKIYKDAYSWEIKKRERISNSKEFDLKILTNDQIQEEALSALAKAWSLRVELEKQGRVALDEIVKFNNYPGNVRGTLRDTLSYLLMSFLQNSGDWTFKNNEETEALNWSELINGKSDIEIKNIDIHPLVKISYILTDLEKWHHSRGEKEAALEARLEKYRSVIENFSDKKKKKEIISLLEKELAQNKKNSWVAQGYAVLASFVKELDELDSNIKAYAFAKEGASLFPKSIGAARCRDLIKIIEQPTLHIEGMNIDGPASKGLLVRYTNLKKIYFRSYKIDFKKFIQTTKDYSSRPGWRELEDLISKTPDNSWSHNLVPSVDFKGHQEIISLPKLENGFYVIFGSSDEQFRSGIVQGIEQFISDFTFSINRANVDNGYEVVVQSGKNGERVAGADVLIYSLDYQKGHSLEQKITTNKNGEARVEHSKSSRSQGRGSIVVIEKNGQLVGSKNFIYPGYSSSSKYNINESLIYTDRSVYRPLQKISWKVVAYKATSGEGNLKVDPQIPIKVELHDYNGQVVSSVEVKSNKFGSAAGEFDIPQGKTLGQWYITTNHGGRHYVRVEEYKRPTFIVEFKDQAYQLRLNHQAEINGNAKYYFGMPVEKAKLKWSVSRKVNLPWWCFWGRWNFDAIENPNIIASGSSKLKDDGSFNIKFTPQTAQSLFGDNKGILYVYDVKVDVTDEGGETRSASKSFFVSVTAVDAKISLDKNFYLNNGKPIVTVFRSDLAGTPLKGKGSWKLVKLKIPKTTLNPADIAPSKHFTKLINTKYMTPDDLKQSRWEARYNPQLYLHDWDEERTVQNGQLAIGENGKSDVNITVLKEGAYRFIYKTKDSFGEEIEESKEFLVAGDKLNFNLPLYFSLEKSSVDVGEKAKLLITSGFRDQLVILETFKSGNLFKREYINLENKPTLIELPIAEEDRGGMAFTLRSINDYQEIRLSENLMVPWSNKELDLEFATFRDKLSPQTKEKWTLKVKSKKGKKLKSEIYEILAYMYDKSLDIISPHNPANPLSLYPTKTWSSFPETELGAAIVVYTNKTYFNIILESRNLEVDQMIYFPNYGIGGPGMRDSLGGFASAMPMDLDSAASREEMVKARSKSISEKSLAAPVAPARRDEMVMNSLEKESNKSSTNKTESTSEIRSNFAETAFWLPQLTTDKNGTVNIEFDVPDSLTSWQVWANVISADLQSGKINKEARTIKDLMVRPYLPRFFREGDEIDVKIMISNSSSKELTGKLEFDILDQNQKSVLEKFKAKNEKQNFTLKAQSNTTKNISLKIPSGSGVFQVKVKANAASFSDGEIRNIALLPGRMHLAESRFVTLKNKDRKDLSFNDLEKTEDSSRINEQLTLTVDGQLFYSVLSALPYIVNHSYKSCEQAMSSFLSTGIITSIFDEFPSIKTMAKDFSSRTSKLERWDSEDPNRKISLEETPWLVEAQGGEKDLELLNILNPDNANEIKKKSLDLLINSQTASGGFPWFPGGPPSPYMTMEILFGFSKAIEFKVDVPKDAIVKAWGYLHQHYVNEILKSMQSADCCSEFVTFINFVLNQYPDSSWSGKVFTEAEKKQMLDFSMKHWKEHSPYMKSYLARTLKKAKRDNEAKLVWDSVMDSVIISKDEGAHWAMEDKSWLWYNDTISTHAMALRTGADLATKPEVLEGLVQWLFLNKKLNHWKSTLATSEVIYSLAHYLKKTKQLGIKEEVKVSLGKEVIEFKFDPSKYSGKKNQVVYRNEEVNNSLLPIIVEKTTPGFMFASATWNYSTEKMPTKGVGDFFNISRKYFKREVNKDHKQLTELKAGDIILIGDEVQVQVSINSKHPSEYIHLKDPRPAGFEPMAIRSEHKWDLGIYWYEEVRDSATNFFFERLPQGEYNFKYSIKATHAGKFKAAPATLQPLYAPEFSAYSGGEELIIK